MESIGRLAGGVAHDFNNILSAVMGFAELTRIKMDDRDPLRPNMEQIISAGTKAAELTEQLLAFSRKQIIKPEPIYLNLLLNDMQPIIRRLIESNIDLAVEKDDDLWPIMADPLQVNQVLINLIVNSRDAMPVGGTISLRTRNVAHDDASLGNIPGLTPGDFVLFSLADTGVGIPEQVLEHIFEPFFTTKDVGKGTGLGLATVYGIVKQNEGHISVHSKPGEGTTFEILFPRSLQTTPTEDSTAVSSFPRGRETILVAEDESQVRALVVEVLNELGYKTIEAGNGAEAAELLVEHCNNIDLVLSDIIMPGMSGRDLADRASHVCPNIAVLFMSGYTDDDILKYGIARDEVRFLQKPVTPAKIALAVRETLDEYWTRKRS
jgi:CheY-like chemotaxis protein